MKGQATPSGSLKARKITTYELKFKRWMKLLGYRLRILKKSLINFGGDINYLGTLEAKVIRKNGSIEDLGLISTKAVTDVGVAFIVDAFQDLTEVETMRFHDCGTGTTAESQTDTALVTPYGGARATGTRTEGASANIYRTVGTISFTSSLAITEHGIFSASTAGTLLDRSVFAAINVTNGDSIEFTYELTFPANG